MHKERKRIERIYIVTMSVLNAARRRRRLLKVFVTIILIVTTVIPSSLSSPLVLSTTTTTTTTTAICKNEPNIKFQIVVQKNNQIEKQEKKRGCEWVKRKRRRRCKKKGMVVLAAVVVDEGNTIPTTTTAIKAVWKLCKDSCGVCFNTDPSNECLDNPYLFYKNKKYKNCNQWVSNSGQKKKRCNKKWRNQKIKNYCQASCNNNNNNVGGACISTSILSTSPSSSPSSSRSFVPRLSLSPSVTSEVPSSSTEPSVVPSNTPSTATPSTMPSMKPCMAPSSSTEPSVVPSNTPSTTTPTKMPSTKPSMAPSSSTEPSVVPSNTPSTTTPSTMPSTKPSMAPSSSTEPSAVPSNIQSTTTMPSTPSKIKKVQVFILLGQSNMVGLGRVDGLERKLYPFLIDDDDNWKNEICVVNDTDNDIVQKRVRNMFVMGSGNTALIDRNDNQMKVNEWMTIKDKAYIGPEIGIGYQLSTMSAQSKDVVDNDNNNFGDGNKEPIILLLKSCIGNRALGWDLLPPASESFVYTDYNTNNEIENVWQYAGYGDSPERWKNGTEPVGNRWYAGKQYDGDVARAQEILQNLPHYVTEIAPDADIEISGFFFWQGDRDRYDDAHAKRYKKNLEAFIDQVRHDFSSPEAKFVLATLGQTKIKANDDTSADNNDQLIFRAQTEISNLTDINGLQKFEGNVACVYSNPYCPVGASNSHYNNDAETYMDVGLAMGKVMAELLTPTTPTITITTDTAAVAAAATTETSSIHKARSVKENNNGVDLSLVRRRLFDRSNLKDEFNSARAETPEVFTVYMTTTPS